MIGYSAFYNCKNLENVELQEGVEALGDLVFAKCGSLKSLVLPSTLKSFRFSEVFSAPRDLEIIYNGTEEEFKEILQSNDMPDFFRLKHIKYLK